jgi:hypothetical protein
MPLHGPAHHGLRCPPSLTLPTVTPPGDTARNLALALDAFLAEHRGCWRVYGEGLRSGEDGAILWVEWGSCEAILRVIRALTIRAREDIE